MSFRVDPDEPALNPGFQSTMTWKPRAAVRQARRIFKTALMKSLAQFVLDRKLLDTNGKAIESLRAFILERADQFNGMGIILHPASFLLKSCQLHGLVTLQDGQRLFISFFRHDPPPLRGIYRFIWESKAEESLQAQLSPADLANLRLFVEKIAPEFAPVAPQGPGLGLGNRMSTLDYPVAYEVVQRYGVSAGVIQGSVFREMAPEKMFRRRNSPLIDLPGIGLIPLGHTGNSIQGQFLAGIIYRIERGIDLPIVADADHIPIRGTSKLVMKNTWMLVKEAQDRTLFTLDPHFCLYGGHPNLRADPRRLEKTFRKLPRNRQTEILQRYEGKEFQIAYLTGDGSFQINMTHDEVIDVAVRFEEAIEVIANTWAMIETVRAGRPYGVEVSIDEAPGITEPHHLFYLASELDIRGLTPFSIAPGLGFTKKDLDIEGPIEPFERRVRQLASVAHEFGAVLGIHSGDGKSFSTRRILAQATGGNFWYKVSPDRQRNFFKALSKFPAGSFERTLYEDIFDWTLCCALRLALEAKGETAQAAREAIEEVLAQETSTAHKLRRKFDEGLLRLNMKESLQILLAEMEKTVRSPFSDMMRDPDFRIIHDYAFIYVGQRSAEGGFLHRGRFFAISEEAQKAYQEEDRAYLLEMLEALGLSKGE